MQSQKVFSETGTSAYFEMTVPNLTCHKLLDQLGDEAPVLELRKRKSSSVFLFNGASESKLWLHTGTLYYIEVWSAEVKKGQ